MRLVCWLLTLVIVVAVPAGGCHDEPEPEYRAVSEHPGAAEPKGRTIRIRAPRTSVDVFIPDDDDEDIRVDVDVDD
jgi:hypothetical protein